MKIPTSEIQLQRELKHSVVSGRRHHPEIVRSGIHSGRVGIDGSGEGCEGRVIEGIEDFRPELQFNAFPEREVLIEGQIPSVNARSAHAVAPHRAESSGFRSRESVNIEELLCSARTLRIVDDVGALILNGSYACDVRAHSNVERSPRP